MDVAYRIDRKSSATFSVVVSFMEYRRKALKLNLKSVDLTVVPVRVRPPAPNHINQDKSGLREVFPEP